MKSTGSFPAPLTSFVGRVAELQTLGGLLTTNRLVTVSGPGGVGKTRIAVELARREAGAMETRWLDLAAVDSDARVALLAAEAAEVLVREGDPLIGLGRQLARRRMLFVIDNCEHVLDAVAELVAVLLREAPGVTVLVTSREALSVPGEHVYRVPGLNSDDAMELFRQRASGAMNPEHETSVRRACARLDGVPLAIELAAAWTVALTPRQILDGLDDRFALLVRRARGSSARHHTLTASMEWSHGLLDEHEQTLFRRLSVFTGAFTFEAAARVCRRDDLDVPAIRDLLRRLIDKSLVVADTLHVEARYRMLESVREFASLRLTASGEEHAVRMRQLIELLDWVRELRPLLDTDIEVWRSRLTPLADTFRSAVEYGLGLDDVSTGRELAAELPQLWHSGTSGIDGIRLLRRALEPNDEAPTPLRARLLNGLALVADTAAPFGLEYDAAQAALDIADEVGDRRAKALALLLSGVGAFYSDLAAGEDLAGQARDLARQVGYPYVEHAGTALLGIIAHLRDEHSNAEALLADATRGLEDLGERGIAATAHGFLALGALYTGRFTEAVTRARRSVDCATPLNDFHRLGTALSVLAIVQGATGDRAAAQVTLRPLLGMLDVPDPPFVPMLGRAVGLLHLWNDRPADAARLFTQLIDEGAPFGDTYLSAEIKAGLIVALRRMGRTERARALAADVLAASRAMGLPRIIANVLEESAVLSEDDATAEALTFKALAIRSEHSLRPDVIRSLEAVAERWSNRGGDADAVRLRAAAASAGDALFAASNSGRRVVPDSASGVPPMSLEDATAFALRARGPRRRPASGWESLTPTEREVMRLAVLGLSNPDIGARLFMSRATVKTHLSHIYSKLGVANRTELAAESAKQATP